MISKTLAAASIVAVVVANLAIFVVRARRNSHAGERDPVPRIGRALVVWVLPPFLLMALGAAMGWSGLMPGGHQEEHATAYDVLCFGAFVILYARGTVWLFREGGAEFVSEPRLLNGPQSPTMVKVYWVLLVAAGLVGGGMSLAK